MLCLIKPLPNNKLAYSLCFMLSTIFPLTPFAFLFSLLSTVIKEYIFDFNPTD